MSYMQLALHVLGKTLEDHQTKSTRTWGIQVGMDKMLKHRYGPYSSNCGHLFYIDLFTDGTRKSVWLHREMLEKHLGRKLTNTEIVHHKNENKLDNRIDNFEIKTQAEHASEHHALPEMLEIVCLQCSNLTFVFARNVRRNQSKNGKAGPFCSRSCAGRWSRLKQLENEKINLMGP